MLQKEINRANRLILDAESVLSTQLPVEQDAAHRLPDGLNAGLVLHYRFDEQHDFHVVDSTMHGNHGVSQGA